MYLIRSMSTTDYAPQWGQYPVPYHIYLLAEGHRDRAYWSRCDRFQRFATPQEAEAYGKKTLSSDNFQIVPEKDGDMPTYWELQDMNRPHWQTYMGRDHDGRERTEEEAKKSCAFCVDYEERRKQMKVEGLI